MRGHRLVPVPWDPTGWSTPHPHARLPVPPLDAAVTAPFGSGTGWVSLSLVTSLCLHSLLFMVREAGFQGRK